MELKYQNKLGLPLRTTCSNRTFMELKYNQDFAPASMNPF